MRVTSASDACVLGCSRKRTPGSWKSKKSVLSELPWQTNRYFLLHHCRWTSSGGTRSGDPVFPPAREVLIEHKPEPELFVGSKVMNIEWYYFTAVCMCVWLRVFLFVFCFLGCICFVLSVFLFLRLFIEPSNSCFNCITGKDHLVHSASSLNLTVSLNLRPCTSATLYLLPPPPPPPFPKHTHIPC